MVLTTGGHILVRKLANATESQERTETQGGGRMGILQSITDQDAVLIMLEDDLLLQDDTSYTISGGRHLGGIKLTDVLVSVRTEIVALILVESEVELSTMLDDRTVE